jgi:hypothetical protein
MIAEQPPSIAVLAVRRWTLAVALLTSLSAIVGLLAAYGQLELLPHDTWPTRLAWIDVAAPGSLAAWLSSLFLVTAAFQGTQIYRLRRHRTDDYRGRYRIWVWIPLVLLLMAADAATGLHADLIAALRLVAAEEGLGYLRFWPLAACLLWALVGLRLGFEVRDSRASLTSLVAATFGYVVAAIAGCLEVQPLSRILLVMAGSSALMLGHLALFMTIALYGRHVYLDAQGLVPARSSNRSRSRSLRKREKTVSRQSKRGQEDADKSTGEANRREKVIPIDSIQAPKSAPDGPREADESATAALSKAERRRLRKLKRRERQQRAA